MTVEVEVTPVGTTALDDILAGWERRAQTLAVAFVAVAADFHALQARRFAAEGPGWKPLADSTIRDRSRRGYGGAHPILRRTGALQDSFVEPAAPYAVFRVSPDEMFVGSSDPIATYHQNGGDNDRPPQRRLVDLSTADEVRWFGILARYLAFGESTAEVVVSSTAGPPGAKITGPS